MVEAKTETKNVKVAKMVEFIKTCDQHPHKFNFGHFFSSLILPPFFWGKNPFGDVTPLGFHRNMSVYL